MKETHHPSAMRLIVTPGCNWERIESRELVDRVPRGVEDADEGLQLGKN